MHNLSCLELAGPMTVPTQIPAETQKKCVIPSAASFARCCYSPCGIVAKLHASWLLGNSLATVVAPPSAPWYNTKENHSNSAAAQENKTARNSQFRLQEYPEMILKCALLLIITLLCSNCGQRIGITSLKLLKHSFKFQLLTQGTLPPSSWISSRLKYSGLLISSNACGPNNPLKEIL